MKYGTNLFAAAWMACAAALFAHPAVAAQNAPLSREEAQAVALNHAGVTVAQTARLTVRYDADDGRPEYEVEFRVGAYEYDYDIDARTGRILSFDVEREGRPGDGQPATPPPAGAAVSAAEAKSIALSHAGASEAETSRLTVRLDRDDRRPEYEVEFCAGSYEYDYEIDAATGRILSFEVDRKGGSSRAVSGPSSWTTAYEGFASGEDGAVRGTVKLTAKATVKSGAGWGVAVTNWTFTAQAVLQTKTVSFNSAGWAGREGEIVFSNKTGETLDVRLEAGRFRGTLSGGAAGDLLDVEGTQNIFADTRDDRPKHGRHRADMDRRQSGLIQSKGDGAYGVAADSRGQSENRLCIMTA
jgi:uncharacterized membrane protein YkoI